MLAREGCLKYVDRTVFKGKNCTQKVGLVFSLINSNCSFNDT